MGKKGKAFWGKIIWEAIHTLAATYDPSRKVYYKKFIMALTRILPCGVCREHLKVNLEKYPIDNYLGSSKLLLLWTYILHDAVNQQPMYHI